MTDTHKVITTGSGHLAVRDTVHGINTYGFECREDAEKACGIAAEKYAKARAKKAKPAAKAEAPAEPTPAPEPVAEEAPVAEKPAAKSNKKPAKKKKRR